MVGLDIFKVTLLLTGAILLSEIEFSSATSRLTTLAGNVTGFETKVNGKEIEVFYGIPYAAPPVGTFRMLLPQPAQVWGKSKPLDGTPPFMHATSWHRVSPS